MNNLQPIIPLNPFTPSQKQFIIPAEYQNTTNQMQLVLKSFGTSIAKTGAFVLTTGNFTISDIDDGYYNPVKGGAFGLPIFDSIFFKSKTWTDNRGNQITIGDGISQYMISTCLIEVNQSRNIIKTPVQGRDGTVKEYISDGDFEINIKGMLASNQQNIFPQHDKSVSTGTSEMGFQTMQAFRYCKESISVSSNILNYFGVTDIVIEEFRYNQQEGDRSLVPFEIRAVSDTSYNIKLKYNE